MKSLMRSSSLFPVITALILHIIFPQARASEYSLSVLSPEEAGRQPSENSTSRSKAIVEDVEFDVPDVVKSLNGVQFRVLRGSTELFIGNLDDLKSGELTFGVNDSQLVLGTNLLEVEFFVPPSPEIIARSQMIIELGESKGILRQLTTGRRGWALGASGAAAAGLAILGLRKHFYQMPSHHNNIASTILQRSSTGVPAKSVPAPPSVVPSTAVTGHDRESIPTEAAPAPPKAPSTSKSIDSTGLSKKPFRRSASWLQAPMTGADFGALKHGVRNVHVGSRGKIAVSAVGAAVVGQLVSSIIRTVSNLLESRRRNSLSPPERMRDDFQALITRIRSFLSHLYIR
jgi:hypothetical protein